MSGLDKAKNKADELAGRAKEKSGEITGNKTKQNEGKADLKGAAEKVKDAFRK
ncbi:CsbD family protein [Nocardia sp. SYP-A9097]|uniref:CsbD family protein n=1 Tax=Nocardia sp. SYP-A9097 TaxID=2663237 RepID=UPI00129A3A57|nr:CsbD family protein [Nocardia sp. SYP-A9097]MRH90705.1 CsbD family protein [Nocardia sp. SYP-A9097]